MYLKKIIGMGLAALLLVMLGIIIETPEGMSIEGQKVMGIVACALALWIFDVFPIGISSVCAMVLITVLGVAEFNEALSQFMGTATFFVIVTYAISCALTETPLSKRILRGMIKIAGTKTERIILALMLVTAFLSAFMSNIPVTAMMMSISLGILKAMNAHPGHSNIGRTLMIGIPFAAMCGGIATPAGSSVNVVAIQLLDEINGTSISFLEWMIYGVPLMLVLIPVTWFMVIKTFKPETIPAEIIDKIIYEDDIPKNITTREWKAIIIICATIVLWIMGSWIPTLNMTLVATLSMIAFFLPGINIFTFDDFAKSISWDAVFTVGSVMCLGTSVVNTGLGEWLLNIIFANAEAWPAIVLFIFIALVINFIHLVLPVAPAIVTMILPSLLVLAEVGNYNPTAFTVVVAMMSTCIMLLPIDTVTVLTYSKKYYSIADMLKVGVPTSCMWAVIIAVWVFMISGMI